ncbi:unnamed protein product [Owenia fusiformis]|uniref:Uncharacterized protein n=1 Tax=Owenia fusiformis TaxID=6347 RepID=A0A8J1TGM6_OWEFU|nr:unnamed protein product [Owenia fusiformis]
MAAEVMSIDPFKRNAYSENVKFDIPDKGKKYSTGPKSPVTGAADIPSDGAIEVYNPEINMKKAPPKEWELDVKGMISTKKWLANYGLRRNRLDMHHVLPQIGFKHSDEFDSSMKKPISSRYGDGLFQRFNRNDGRTFNVTCGKEKLKQLANRLSQAILLYKRRLEWLTTESRRIFGVIEEHCVCIVLDIKNMSPQQFDQFRCAMERVLREQVSQLAKFNIMRAAEDSVKYQPEAIPVTKATIEGAINWMWNIDRLAAVSKTATCECVLNAMTDHNIEAVYLFTEGQSVDGSRELLKERIKNKSESVQVRGGPMPLHVVSYNCSDPTTISFLKQIAAVTGGRFHAYAVIMEMDSYEGLPVDPNTNRANIVLKKKTYGGVPSGAGLREDVILLFEELEDARNTLAQIQALMDEVPDPPNTYEPVTEAYEPKKRSEQYMDSKEWLQKHGLSAKRLGFFDVLGGVAFKHCDGVVDSMKPPCEEDEQTNAIIQPKLVNARYCDKFAHVRWRDGRVVHVQVTPEIHRNYEQRMRTTLEAIKQRIDWLHLGSRELFGTVLEDQVYFLIDVSGSMVPSIQFVKDKLFVLMQEQLRHKQKVNFVAFSSKAVPWKDRLVDVNERNLQGAWAWIQSLSCQGSTNTLAALKFALADHQTHAIYLLSDGRPDQPPKNILAQVQLSQRIPIHTISFNCQDEGANDFLCNLAKDTGGRFHYFSEHGIDIEVGPDPWESEDVRLLRQELNLGETNLEKVEKLRDECQALSWRKEVVRKCSKEHSLLGNRTSAVPALDTKLLYRSTVNSNSLSRRPKSAHKGVRSSPVPPPRPSTSLSHRAKSARSPRSRSSSDPARPLSGRKPLVSYHTRTSLLRTLGSSGHFEESEWLLPETKELFEKQYERQLVLNEEGQQNQKKRNRRIKKLTDEKYMSSKKWLGTHGLVARKLTILDALAPTIIPHTPKYVPILDKHVLSKVFDDIMPIAHASTSDKRKIKLVNPNAVDLEGYEERLQGALKSYKKRLNDIVWNALPQEEKDQFNSHRAVDFNDNKLRLLQALDRCGWPITGTDITLLEDEIQQGHKYLQQSRDLKRSGKRKDQDSESEDSDLDNDSNNNDDRESIKSESSKRSEKDNSDDNDDEDAKNYDEAASVASSIRSSRSNRSSKSFEGLGEVMESKPTKGKKAPPTNNKVKKALDSLRGQSVIARWDQDGFYYAGLVIKCTDSRHALVEFHHNQSKETIPTRFVIPIGGAVSRPPLRIGDYVLARVLNADTKEECYVPGIIQVTPRRIQDQAKFFTLTLYNGEQATTMRNYIIKISKARFSFACRYLEECQKANDDREEEEERKKAEGDRLKDEDESRSSSRSSSRSQSPSGSEEHSNRKKGSRGKVLAEHDQKLASLQRALEKQQKRQERQQRQLKKQQRKLAKARKRLKEQENQNKNDGTYARLLADYHRLLDDATKNKSPRQSESRGDLTDRWVEEHKSQPSEDGRGLHVQISTEEDKESIMLTDGEKGLLISRNQPDFTPPALLELRRSLPKLKEGEEVLARWGDEGWYYRGTLRQDCEDYSYFVEDSVGDLEKIWREDIITDNDDAGNVLQYKDPVIGLHPSYAFSYAPGIIVETHKDLWNTIRFYDGTEAKTPREETFKISREKFEFDVAYILSCEDQWVGQAVVARNDATGTYHLGSIREKIGNNRQYVIEWSDGSLSVQSATFIFGAITKRHPLAIGDRVLAIADESQLLYLPGWITDSDGEKLTVKFANKQKSDDVDPVQCFWLSQDYYDNAVSYYKSRQAE